MKVKDRRKEKDTAPSQLKRKVIESPIEGLQVKKLMASAIQIMKGAKVRSFLLSLIFSNPELRQLLHASFSFTGV